MLDLIRSNNNVAGRMKKKTQPHELWRHHESRDIYNGILFLFLVSIFSGMEMSLNLHNRVVGGTWISSYERGARYHDLYWR